MYKNIYKFVLNLQNNEINQNMLNLCKLFQNILKKIIKKLYKV
jgi:hypothetical protein